MRTPFLAEPGLSVRDLLDGDSRHSDQSFPRRKVGRVAKAIGGFGLIVIGLKSS
jgi:hypothetical protein